MQEEVSNPLFLALIMFGISFFTSMGGVSGAFLLLPLQVSFLGVETPSASATNHMYNVFAIPGGVYKYFKNRLLLWRLALIIAIYSLPGTLLGAFIRIEILPDAKSFKFFASFVLFFIGLRLAASIWQKSKKILPTAPKAKAICETEFNFKRLSYKYGEVNYSINAIAVGAISFFVGILGGVYGIGGGAIMSPLLVSTFGLPAASIAGAALLSTLATSIFSAVQYWLLSNFYADVAIAPDFSLAAVFGVGGFIGVYFGARFQKYFPEKLIKAIIAISILFIAWKYFLDYFQ